MDEADRQNLLGFRQKIIDKATFHYEQALRIDPNHKGALEKGELFLSLGQKVKLRTI